MKPGSVSRAAGRRRLRVAPLLACGLLIALAAGCDAGAPAPSASSSPASAAAGPLSVPVRMAGTRFDLELAGDPVARMRGLGGRDRVDPSSGMLFAFVRAAPLSFVMRDCPIPLDIAFLDASGRVVAMYTMAVEPPRRPDETPFTYEERLPLYQSGVPAQFAIETAGGRLAGIGLHVGDVVEFDRAAVLRHTR